ncbi:hypothetical protein [Bradyrhizobium iriomotense]|uniref:Uncharacterized protein n=1 Tax=Bradyrhizobium iriomotense TaxID=441950 RepID=A0ABQ6B2N4_9BRAD|nr:hypothetical protein [Bradyrhizobium iriomotense]GLR87945.1 hypothetical protein GCM10007857_46570 [Bradyrhizobium iriomotense]
MNPARASLARRVHRAAWNPREVPIVAGPDEQIMLMANLIERYLSEHPEAGDTVDGIQQWWLEGHGGSLDQLQQALDYLVENVRLSRIVLADGTVIYARAGPSG